MLETNADCTRSATSGLSVSTATPSSSSVASSTVWIVLPADRAVAAALPSAQGLSTSL